MLRSTSLLLVEQFLSLVLGFLVNIFLIRYLGPGLLGVYSYGLSVVAIVGILAKLGLDGLVVKALVQESDRADEIMGTAFWLKGFGAIIAIAITIITALLIETDLQSRLIIMVLATSLLFQAFDIINFWNQSRVQATAMVSVRLISNIFGLGSKAILIAINAPLIAFAWVFTGEAAVRAVGMVFTYLRANQAMSKWRFNRQRATSFMHEGWPLLLSGGMALIYMKIDQIMLAKLSSAEAVGMYAAAVKFSEIWYFIPIALTSSLFPMIIKINADGEGQFTHRMQQLFDVLALGAYSIAAPITFAAPIIIPRILGSDFRESAIMLSIHIWAGVFIFLEAGRIRWLLIKKENFFQLSSMTIGAISNILLNFLLIPSFHGVGAAVATLISYALAVVASCFIMPAHRLLGKQLVKATLIPARWKDINFYSRKTFEFAREKIQGPRLSA